MGWRSESGYPQRVTLSPFEHLHNVRELAPLDADDVVDFETLLPTSASVTMVTEWVIRGSGFQRMFHH